MEILRLNERTHQEIIAAAVEVLDAGGLVVFPTETTYGIGADATNGLAVQKLLHYKRKRSGKALSVMVADQAMAEEYVELNDTARSIYQKFLPGPVTVVSVGKHKVAKDVESSSGTLGIRISSYGLVQEIARKLGRPFTATGANASSERRPYTIEDIFQPLSEKQAGLIDLVIDAGELPHNDPSTVIDTTLESYWVLRQGKIEFEENNRILSRSPDETQQFGKELVQRFRNDFGHKALIFALEGEMGAGKTQFVKGMALGLGVSEPVRSPSYTLVHEHPFFAEGRNLKLVHIDAWRLEQADEIDRLGLDEYVDEKSVIALEWANSEVEAIQKLGQGGKIIWVKLSYAAGENERLIAWKMLT